MEGDRDLVFRPDRGTVKKHIREGSRGRYAVEGIAPDGRYVYKTAVRYRNRFMRPFAIFTAWLMKKGARQVIDEHKDTPVSPYTQIKTRYYV